jgi:DNA-binding transcriptional MerR regulator
MSKPKQNEIEYSTSQIAKAVGVSLRQMQWWDETGIIRARRRGRVRVYTITTGVLCSVAAELRDSGMSCQKIRRARKYLVDNLGEARLRSKLPLYLLTDGAFCQLAFSGDQVIDVMKAARRPLVMVCVHESATRIFALDSNRKNVHHGSAAPGLQNASSRSGEGDGRNAGPA